MTRTFTCIMCGLMSDKSYCGCIGREEQRKKDMEAKEKTVGSPDVIFEMADKLGVKKDMIDTIKAVLAEHKNVDPMIRKFGPEELYFALHMGLADSGVPNNFTYRSSFTLGRAYLFAYLLGRAVIKESERKNVEAPNKA
jgi:hypothetical protein